MDVKGLRDAGAPVEPSCLSYINRYTTNAE